MDRPRFEKTTSNGWVRTTSDVENKGVTRIRSLELRRPPNVVFGPVSPQFNPFPRPMMYLENAMKFVWISAALAAVASVNSAQAGLFHHNSCNSCNSAPSCAAPAACVAAAPTCAAPAAAACAPSCAAPVATCAPVATSCAPVASTCAPVSSCGCAPRCHKIRLPKLCMPKIRLHKPNFCGSTCGTTSCAPSCAAPAVTSCAPSCAAPATTCVN